MVQPTPCPGRQQLAQFLLGRLAEPETDSLGIHLLDCPHCQVVATNLEAEDTLVKAMRRLKAADTDQALLQKLIARMRDLPDSAGGDPRRTIAYVPADEPAGGGELALLSAGPAAEAERPLLAGSETLEALGRGGMGVVYRARQVRLNRIVALKMILAGAHPGPRELARFRAEARALALARLQHPNIVQVYEINEHEGRP